MTFFSIISSLIFSLWLASVGTWQNLIVAESVVTDNAASVINSNWPISIEDTTNVSFASLLDALKGLATSTVATTTTEEIAVATSSLAIESATALDEAIVNIYCTQQTDDYKKTISGSGFFISERGVILTNAHVGQFVLLEGAEKAGKVDCYIRAGKEAEAALEVDLLYISPSWLVKNASLIAEAEPKGNGESDFALLYVTGARDGYSLPDKFAYLPPSAAPMSSKMKKSTVILVGYPANGATSNNRVIATTTITDIYTFETGYADIFSLSSSILGHQGVSGGPVIDNLGRAIGVITTKDAGTTILNAITISHIDRSLTKETGMDLASTIQGDLGTRASTFNDKISPILQEILAKNLR